MKEIFVGFTVMIVTAIAAIAAGFLVAAATWLIFSFIHWDFAPAEWNGFTRAFAAVFWLFWSALLGTIAVQNAFYQITKRLKRKDDDS